MKLYITRFPLALGELPLRQPPPGLVLYTNWEKGVSERYSETSEALAFGLGCLDEKDALHLLIRSTRKHIWPYCHVWLANRGPNPKGFGGFIYGLPDANAPWPDFEGEVREY